MAPINKPIDKACATLHQSITKLIEQHNRYPPNNVKIEERCLFYVRHANHILRTLVAKRQSLEYAVEAFEECSESYVKEFSRDKSKERQRVILTTWFTHFLRLRGEHSGANVTTEVNINTLMPTFGYFFSTLQMDFN